MEKTYTDRYREELSNIFSSILKIDTKFCTNKKRAKSDFEKGLITEGVYKKVEEADYYTVLDGEASPYSLLEEERNLVVRFIKLSDNGNLYLNDINSTFEDLVGRMDAVAESVKTYFKYYNMSLVELREAVAEMMTEKFLAKKQTILEKKISLETELGQEVVKNSEYIKLTEELNNIEEDENRILNNVKSSSFDVLMTAVSKKYSLNEEFYKWFRVRKNKENYSNGIRPEDSTETMLEEQNNVRRFGESAEIYKDIESKMKDATDLLSAFAVDSLGVSVDIGRRLSLISQYSKKECFVLFEKFFNFAIFYDYCSSYVEDGSIVNSFEVFNKFYERMFVNAKSVDPNEFKFKLIEDVLLHYKRKAGIYSKLLEERKIDLEKWYERLNDSSNRLAIMVRNANDYDADIVDEYSYLDGYLSSDMLDMLYISLDEYLELESKCYKNGISLKKENN